MNMATIGRVSHNSFRPGVRVRKPATERRGFLTHEGNRPDLSGQVSKLLTSLSISDTYIAKKLSEETGFISIPSSFSKHYVRNSLIGMGLGAAGIAFGAVWSWAAGTILIAASIGYLGYKGIPRLYQGLKSFVREREAAPPPPPEEKELDVVSEEVCSEEIKPMPALGEEAPTLLTGDVTKLKNDLENILYGNVAPQNSDEAFAWIKRVNQIKKEHSQLEDRALTARDILTQIVKEAE